MYNANSPPPDELPSTATLIKSTIIALIAAIAILVTVVLPAEYGVDPTGIGRALKLTEMGEIKKQLAEEAEADRARHGGETAAEKPPGPQSSLLGRVLGELLVGRAMAQPVATDQPAQRSDEIVIELNPTQGVEWKLSMRKGAEVRYSWSVEGGVVNYDLHGTPSAGGKESSYKAQRGVAGDEGVLTAAFDGHHGWFFRNRGENPVKVKLKVQGAYGELKRMM